MSLEIEEFDVDDHLYAEDGDFFSRPCYDHLKIVDGDGTTLMEETCGKNGQFIQPGQDQKDQKQTSLPPIISKTNKVILKFYTSQCLKNGRRLKILKRLLKNDEFLLVKRFLLSFAQFS